MLQNILNLEGINSISRSSQEKVNGGTIPNCWSGPGWPPINIPICPGPPDANH